MKFRNDVQLLRGVAVLLVVLFHLGIGRFQSGFLGVDIFFVISGFLMALLYQPTKKADFFGRRAQRLLPAYTATVLATLIASVLLVTPTDFQQVVTQSLFAAFFSSNVGFWFENSYFDKASFKPLLHLWSLGVEMQFYLFVPLVAWFIRKARWPGLWTLIVGSLVLCFGMVLLSPKTSFFLLPFRLWEFLIGFACAKYLDERRGPLGPKWLGAGGLGLLLLIPLLPVDGESRSLLNGHPSLGALGVSVATVLVLLFQLPERIEVSWPGRWLQKLGDCSYSVYLAHFPIIVLFLYNPLSGTRLSSGSVGQLATVSALLALGSYLLYQFVEKPFRRPGSIRLRTWSGAVAGVTAVVAVTYQVQVQMLPPQEKAIYAAWTDRVTYRCGKVVRVLDPTSPICEVGAELANPIRRVVLVGNSHADSIKHAFTEEANSRGVGVLFIVDNAPLQPGGMSPEQLVSEALRRGADALVLHYAPRSISAVTVERLVQLAAVRGISTSFILPVPVWKRHVPKMLLDNLKLGVPIETQTLQQYHQANSSFTGALRAMPALKVYDVSRYLCPELCRVTSAAGSLLYFDQHHLTLAGSAELRPVLRAIIDDLLAAPSPVQTSAPWTHSSR